MRIWLKKRPAGVAYCFTSLVISYVLISLMFSHSDYQPQQVYDDFSFVYACRDPRSCQDLAEHLIYHLAPVIASQIVLNKYSRLVRNDTLPVRHPFNPDNDIIEHISSKLDLSELSVISQLANQYNQLKLVHVNRNYLLPVFHTFLAVSNKSITRHMSAWDKLMLRVRDECRLALNGNCMEIKFDSIVSGLGDNLVNNLTSYLSIRQSTNLTDKEVIDLASKNTRFKLVKAANSTFYEIKLVFPQKHKFNEKLSLLRAQNLKILLVVFVLMAFLSVLIAL